MRWTDELDDELARRVADQDRIAAALVELERHQGHRLLATTALRGESAARWATVGALLPRLWTDLATHWTAVDAACAVRTRRTRPGRQEWVELNWLLAEPSIAVNGSPGDLHAPGIPRPAALEHTETLSRVVERLHRGIDHVIEVLDHAESVHLAAVAALGPLAERLCDLRAAATGLLAPDDPDVAVLTTLTADVDARIAECAHDPLAHAPLPPSGLGHELTDDVDRALAPLEARLTALAAVRDAWAQQRAEVTDAVTALDGLCEREDRARHAAHAVVAGTLPRPADPRPALHRRLAALPGPTARPGPAALAALPLLRADAADAADDLRAAVERAVGLVDRYGELRGRFASYRAKAVRLGVAEDPEVSTRDARVAAVLRDRPVDLRVLTPALVAYQQRVRAAAPPAVDAVAVDALAHEAAAADPHGADVRRLG